MGAVFLSNELLAYLQHNRDATDVSSVIQYCTTYFTVVEICEAKAQLCEALNISAKCVPHRSGDENGKKSLQDIMKVLKEMDPVHLPKWCATPAPRTIPVTLDQAKVNRMLQQDIASLQASLEEFKQQFEISQNTIAELRAEIVLLRNSVTGSAVISNIADSERRDMRAAGESHTSVKSAPSADSPRHRTIRRAKRRNIANRQAQPPTLPAENRTGKAQSRPSEPSWNQRRDQVDAEGYTLFQKKRRRQNRQNQCGTASGEPNSPLRAATPRTSLYVSRLHESTTKQDVLDYIFARHKAGVFKDNPRLGVFVEALESHNRVSFTSFVVRVPTAHLDVFTTPEFWPKGVVYRRFRGRLPQKTPKFNFT
ncbi:hypothetical protein NE865_04258 [Phthorimaea operculella]|nr:hypothetical protein NE865_04258 [Phthorimaea operculella]